MAIKETRAPIKAYLAIIFSVLVFATEAVSLRYAAKNQFPTAVIAVTQCTMAGLVQYFLGARFSQVDWQRWWPALLISALNGLSLYLAIRTAPAALVGLIEPLGLVPLMLGYRFILQKQLNFKTILALFMLIMACGATLKEWPEQVTLVALAISAVGILCSGISLVAGEVVPLSGIPSYVLAMQALLAVLSALIGLTLKGVFAGHPDYFWHGVGVGVGTGLLVGLAVSALYYGMQDLGSLRAGTIKILRLPTIAVFAALFVGETATFSSMTALSAVVLFAMLAVFFSYDTKETYLST